MEKLLRSTNVKKLYLLIRPKGGESTEKRLENLLESSVFEKLKRTDQKVFDKIEVVTGNITEKNFGVSAEEREVLIENVNIIFHSAASVSFNDPLTMSVKTNLGRHFCSSRVKILIHSIFQRLFQP